MNQYYLLFLVKRLYIVDTRYCHLSTKPQRRWRTNSSFNRRPSLPPLSPRECSTSRDGAFWFWCLGRGKGLGRAGRRSVKEKAGEMGGACGGRAVQEPVCPPSFFGMWPSGGITAFSPRYHTRPHGTERISSSPPSSRSPPPHK